MTRTFKKKKFPNRFTHLRWRNILKRETEVIRKRSLVLVVLLLLASFLMRRRPNVSDLERS